MNINTLTDLSIHIITEYYKDNLEPYFSHVDDDILWIGPAKGQWLRGRQALLDAWSNEKHDLTFSMNNITSNYITSGSNYCEIILTYGVFTHYPDGHVIHRDQILHYTWCNRNVPDENGKVQKIPKILMIHISNSLPYDSRDAIYPVHLTETTQPQVRHVADSSRILVRGVNQSTYYLLSDTICWMESEDKGTHTKIHTSSESYDVIDSISALSKTYPQLFIRIHSSYLINPLYAHNLRRFQVEMNDGATLPIPQKRFTQVKKEFTDWLTKWNASLG